MDELLELKTRLNQISITGLKSISNDFRLEKIYEKIQIVAKKSSVFSKISNLIGNLIQNQDSKTFAELINLTNAVLSVQNDIDKTKPQKELNIDTLQRNKNNYLTFSQLKQLRDILDGSTTAMWSKLKDFYDTNKLNDYRLLNDFMKILNSTYTYVEGGEELNIVKIISDYDERIIPVLLKEFKTNKDKVSKSNIVKIISNIGKQKYNDYYIKWINEEESEGIVASSIKALIYDKNNLDFLLNLKVKKKKLKQARAYALAHMPGIQAHEEFKEYCTKDKEFLDEFLNDTKPFENKNITFLSENEIIEMLQQCVNDVQNKIAENKNNPAVKYTYPSKEFDNLYITIKAASYYNSDVIVDALVNIVESQIELKDPNYKERKAATILLKIGTKKSYEYVASLNDKFNNYYCDLSFIASINLGYSKEIIFDKFAHLCSKKSNSKSLYNSIISIIYFCKYDSIDINILNIKDFIKNKNIEWDKRWLQYSIDNNLIELSAFFIDETTDNIPKLKQYYIGYINTLKSINPNKAGTEIEKIVSGLTLGLFKTGAKKVAIEILPLIFSISSATYHRYFIDIYIKYLQKEDIESLKQLSWQPQKKSNRYSKWYFDRNINTLIDALDK